MGRYDDERAILASGLPVISRAILLTLATRVNARSGTIPAEHSPSIGRLARMTGASRASVKRHLRALEAAGWLVRDRPPAELARREHRTTAYTITPPGMAHGGPGHSSPGATARPTPGRALGSPEAGPLAHRGPQETETGTDRPTETQHHGGDDSLRTIARTELATLSGRKITDSDAAAAVRLVLDGRDVARPAAYLRRALRADPGRFITRRGAPADRTVAEAIAEATP